MATSKLASAPSRLSIHQNSPTCRSQLAAEIETVPPMTPGFLRKSVAAPSSALATLFRSVTSRAWRTRASINVRGCLPIASAMR